MSMSNSLTGQVALVTGASTGIGAELCRQLAAAGVRVALLARDATRLERVAGECRAAGGEAVVVAADITVETECQSAVERTLAHYGRLDILVNNAGLSSHGRFDAIQDLSVFETLMRVNFYGSVWCTAYALPALKQSRGRIVAVSSLTGLTGVPDRSAYGATKHAVTGFFEAIRVELDDFGVSVTLVYPGFVESEMSRRALGADGAPFGEGAHKRSASEKMSAAECSRIMLRAIERREREVQMTWRGKFGRVLKLVSPSLVDRIAKAGIRERK